MNTLVNWTDKQHITTGEAILAINQLIEKYQVIITRVLKIKQEMPEIGGRFRRQSQNTELLEKLQQVLHELHAKAEEIERELLDKA